MFSASWRILSSSSLVLFLFAIFLEDFSDPAHVDDQIRQRSDDTQHLPPVDESIDLAVVHS